MATTVYRSCPLCEATCGVAITIDGDRVVSVRGDEADPFSRGYICPKAYGVKALHDDPDRLRAPLVRIESPSSAGARSAAQRRGETIEQHETSVDSGHGDLGPHHAAV